MSDTDLEAAVAAYLQTPVTGERLPVTHRLSFGLAALLPQLAAERGVTEEALVEFLLYKQIRSEQARRMVGEPLEPLPSSFTDDRVAQAKVELARDLAAVKALQEQGGDKAARLAAGLQAVLDDAQGTDEHLDQVRRQTAVDDARLDLALEKHGRDE